MNRPRMTRATPAPAAPAPLRTAQRRPVQQTTVGNAEVTTETQMSKKVVSNTARALNIETPDYGDEPLGSVSVKHGKTIPLQDVMFANVRIDVKVTLPCTAENVQSIAEQAHDHVVAIFQAEEDYLLGARPPVRQAQRRG